MEYSAGVPTSMTLRGHIEDLRHLLMPLIKNFSEQARHDPKDNTARKKLAFLRELQEKNQDFCDDMDTIFQMDPDDLYDREPSGLYGYSSNAGNQTGIKWGYSGWRAAGISQVTWELTAVDDGVEQEGEKVLLRPGRGEPHFQWGPASENPEDLAFAILFHYTHSKHYAAMWKARLAQDVINFIQTDQWFISAMDIGAWTDDHPQGLLESHRHLPSHMVNEHP